MPQSNSPDSSPQVWWNGQGHDPGTGHAVAAGSVRRPGFDHAQNAHSLAQGHASRALASAVANLSTEQLNAIAAHPYLYRYNAMFFGSTLPPGVIGGSVGSGLKASPPSIHAQRSDAHYDACPKTCFENDVITASRGPLKPDRIPPLYEYDMARHFGKMKNSRCPIVGTISSVGGSGGHSFESLYRTIYPGLNGFQPVDCAEAGEQDHFLAQAISKTFWDPQSVGIYTEDICYGTLNGIVTFLKFSPDGLNFFPTYNLERKTIGAFTVRFKRASQRSDRDYTAEVDYYEAGLTDRGGSLHLCANDAVHCLL